MRELRSQHVCLGDFEVDLRAGELSVDNQTIRLQEQPFRILLMLIEREGEIVTREEIQKKLWPNDTVVEFDHGINAAIKKLRQALGDSADEPRYIETVARRGYRLMVPVEWTEAPAETPLQRQPVAAEPEIAEFKVGNLTGKTVSHYRVLEIIGGGGMGVVFRAEDLKLGRAVALKFLPEDLHNDPKALARFEQEARAVSALAHPNICDIHEFDEYEGLPFLVMELLHGKTLREHLADGAFRLTDPAGLDIAIQVASGLEAAHEQHIIHRDLKPANIFVTEKNVAKILDFGVAKVLEAGEGQELAVAASREGISSKPVGANLTRTGLKLGTAGYMSPEQIRGEPLDVRTDIFSFGVVLYQMATGERAFSGETETIQQESILKDNPRSVRELTPEISPTLEVIITRCLEKTREQRYANAFELHQALVEVQRCESAPPHERRKFGATRRWVFSSLIAVAVALAIAGGVKYWHSHRATKLTEKDTIVLADFKNSTGETIFDGTLKEGLAINLEQSPFLNVLSARRVSEALKLMNRPATEFLTQDVAREVCLRTNSKAMVTGSISRVGEHYLVGVRAVDCSTTETQASTETEAKNRDWVLHSLSDAGNRLREKLGESLASVKMTNLPLEESTTSSLEALQSLSLGYRTQLEKGSLEAIPYYQRAVQLDPTFARAYQQLGVAYTDVQEKKLSYQYLTKAFELRERVSPPDRLHIEALYYDTVINDLPRAVQIYQQWIDTYPNDPAAHNNLSTVFRDLGQPERMVAEAAASLRLKPDNVFAATNLMVASIDLDKPDDAKAVFETAIARKLDDPMLHAEKYLLSFLQRDQTAMQEQLAWAVGKPRAEYMLLSQQADTEAYYGHLERARTLSGQVLYLAGRERLLEPVAYLTARDALREVEVGNRVRAREMAGRSLQALRKAEFFDFDAPTLLATAAYARSGGVPVYVQNLVNKLASASPSNTLLHNYELPTMQAAIAINNGNPRLAVQTLREVAPYEFSSSLCLYPAYLRGIAYLELHQGDKAAQEFQKILDHPGIVANPGGYGLGGAYVWGALAHLQLGRAQVTMGDQFAARKSYNEFLTLWKDADPDIPIYKQAKAEYARLQ